VCVFVASEIFFAIYNECSSQLTQHQNHNYYMLTCFFRICMFLLLSLLLLFHYSGALTGWQPKYRASIMLAVTHNFILSAVLLSWRLCLHYVELFSSSVRAMMTYLFIGTQQIRFRRKTNEIAKFSILDLKKNLHGIWTKIRIFDEICDFGRTKNDIWTTYY